MTDRIPQGMHTVTPYLVQKNTIKAIDFYKKAFNAEELLLIPGENNKTMHAQIRIGDSVIMMSDECEEMSQLSPESRGGATCQLLLYVEDVDATFAQAAAAGCSVTVPVSDMYWGDRFGKVRDPFGHEWALASHIEDVSHEEMKKRSEAGCRQMAASRGK